MNQALGDKRGCLLFLLVNKQTYLIGENKAITGLFRPVGHTLVTGNRNRPGKKVGARPEICCLPAKHKVGFLKNLARLFTVCQTLEQESVKPRLALG
jgi:hypothetical protein